MISASTASREISVKPPSSTARLRLWVDAVSSVGSSGDAPAAESAPHALPAHVRALAVARRRPVPGDLVWAVGAGTGALAVETARFGAAVVAVEADRSACAQIAVNARRYGVEVEPVHGVGPEVLGGLPEPDAVMVESGGAEVVRAVLARRPERLVAVAHTLAEAEEIREAIAGAGYRVDGALLQSTPLVHAAGLSFGPGEQTLVLWGEQGS